jgi:hypothetical protein
MKEYGSKIDGNGDQDSLIDCRLPMTVWRKRAGLFPGFCVVGITSFVRRGAAKFESGEIERPHSKLRGKGKRYNDLREVLLLHL